MNEEQIEILADRIKEGGVFFLNSDFQIHECLRVHMEWREKMGENRDGTPDLAIPEPAVVLRSGKFAALLNCEPQQFVTLEQVFQEEVIG